MKIALFPSAYYPSLGGVEELSRQLALELCRCGHEVIAITNRWPRNLPRHEKLDGIDVYRPALRTRGSGIKSELSYVLTSNSVRREVSRLVKEFKADLLHVMCVSPGADYAMDTARALRLPLVTTLQGELTMDANRVFQRSKTAQATLRRALSESTSITACSAKTLADAIAFNGGRVESPTHVIFNGALVADFDNVQPTLREKPFVFALGRLVPQKGFDVLLDSLKAQPDCLPNGWELVIAGDGPDESQLRELCRFHGLDGRVRFIGRADHAAVAGLMRGCEFVVVPSRADEGLPVVCAESMAAGKAVVGTRRGGIPEAIIHQENGLIVEPENATDLANAIRQIAHNSELRHAMSAKAYQRSTEFSWPVVTKSYVAVYEEARGLCIRRNGTQNPNRL